MIRTSSGLPLTSILPVRITTESMRCGRYYLQSQHVFASFSDATAHCSHTDWSPPAVLRRSRPPVGQLHAPPRHTRRYCVTTKTNNPAQTCFSLPINVIAPLARWGVSWQTPLWVAPRRPLFSTYSAHQFRECIVNTFAVGHHLFERPLSLYVTGGRVHGVFQHLSD